jgi:hypothetical protein
MIVLFGSVSHGRPERADDVTCRARSADPGFGPQQLVERVTQDGSL